MNQSKTEYNYQSAGFNKFLSRSIDDLNNSNDTLESQTPMPNREIAFDQNQVSGPLGNTMKVGKILIDGITGRISGFDDNGNEGWRLGEQDD